MYRGGAGQWAWWAHRISGAGVLLFLLIHIIDIFLVLFGPELFYKLLILYTHPVFRVAEVGLVAAVLFHALNGIRIAVMDFYPQLHTPQRHQQLVYAVGVVFVLLFLPGAYLMLEPLF